MQHFLLHVSSKQFLHQTKQIAYPSIFFFICFLRKHTKLFPPRMASFMDWQLERSTDLLQNCDLPPPLKLFSPFEKKDNRYNPKVTQWDDELEPNNLVENTSLRRALQLSQSRAREAEKKAAVTSNDKEQLAALFLKESLRLSAHRQWVRLLEIETIILNKKKSLDGDGDDGIDEALTWCLTLALCLGIGFALGRYIF